MGKELNPNIFRSLINLPKKQIWYSNNYKNDLHNTIQIEKILNEIFHENNNDNYTLDNYKFYISNNELFFSKKKIMYINIFIYYSFYLFDKNIKTNFKQKTKNKYFQKVIRTFDYKINFLYKIHNLMENIKNKLKKSIKNLMFVINIFLKRKKYKIKKKYRKKIYIKNKKKNKKTSKTKQLKKNKKYTNINYFSFDILKTILVKKLENKIKIKKIINEFFEITNQIKKIKGIKITIAGRLNNKDKASSISFSKGIVKLQSIKSNVRYFSETNFTTVGAIGIKIWFIF